MTNNLKEEIQSRMKAFRLKTNMAYSEYTDGFWTKKEWLKAYEYTLDYESQLLVALINQKEKELLDKFEEVIGKDDKKKVNNQDYGDDWAVCTTCDTIVQEFSDPPGNCICDWRNELRAEQRDRIKQLKEELSKQRSK